MKSILQFLALATKEWKVDYKGHDIVVQNSISKERLFVDGEFQHENFGIGFRSKLYGKIKTGQEEGMEVKVILGGFWTVQCRIFINQTLVFHSNPDKAVKEILQKNENKSSHLTGKQLR